MSSVQELFNISDQLIKNLEIPHKLEFLSSLK